MSQPIYEVTLEALRKAGACYEGYNKVVRMIQGKTFNEKDAELESYIKHSHVEPVSLVSIARNNGIDDALWALRCVPGCDRDARLFGVWAARQVEHLMTDQRSKNALDVAERFANGIATQSELDAARGAAWAAARDAARAAARDAARDAARAAAGDAAGDAAWDAAWDAAGAAARGAAWAAARGAARGAAGGAARGAAGDAAWDAAGAAQFEMFIAMIEGRAPWQTK
jgi:hypothetical protein